jgi:hypothetical protein
MIRRTPISFASGLTGNASTPKIADVVASGFFGGNDRHTVGAKLRMRPIRLHLDTSDYAAMYQATLETPQARVRDELRELAQSGRIGIGLSYHVVFELLQKAEPTAAPAPRRSSHPVQARLCSALWLRVSQEGLVASKRARRTKRRTWSKADVRELKAHSRSKSPVKKIAKAMKRTVGALRQKALSLGLPLGHRR